MRMAGRDPEDEPRISVGTIGGNPMSAAEGLS